MSFLIRLSLFLYTKSSVVCALALVYLCLVRSLRWQRYNAIHKNYSGGYRAGITVLNKTIRDNILLESKYDEERYQKALYQCALEGDLVLFEARVKSEVVEKGLTLSGGQKARSTLARESYSEAAFLLLDNLLATLDLHASLLASGHGKTWQCVKYTFLQAHEGSDQWNGLVSLLCTSASSGHGCQPLELSRPCSSIIFPRYFKG